MKPKVFIIVGARPNFMKAGPIYFAMQKDFDLKLIHTGQHFDKNMSDIFFTDLKLPKPDVNFNAIGTPTTQIGNVLLKLEAYALEHKPDLIIVLGDVNSTLAGAIVANKMGIKLAHVEAGLRSFDMKMPEETNRIITDIMSDYLFVTEPHGLITLHNRENVFYVGNPMIDTLFKHKDQAGKLKICRKYDLIEKSYILVTIHRPSNVRDNLDNIIKLLNQIAELYPVIFPVHPRTAQKMKGKNKFKTIPPLGYLGFVSLMMDSQIVLTDSGGIQEETTALNIPCLTLRPNTERPVTISNGTNQLVNVDNVMISLKMLMDNDKYIQTREIKGWDGKAGERIAEIVTEILSK